jgi:DNA-binding PadR family transcriptional regulator
MKLITRTEELIILAVLRLGDKAYCVPIFDTLNEISGKKWSLGNIYGPLYRLEQNDYLVSSMGSPTAERGGKSKRFYKVTPKGFQALREIRRVQESSWDGLTDLVFEK